VLTEWSSSGNANLNSKKFTGYERDGATGLDYAGARMYNSGRGRFMQPDPKGLEGAKKDLPQSLNRYSYVGNDPVNQIDPLGTNWIPINPCSFIICDSVTVTAYMNSGNISVAPGIIGGGAIVAELLDGNEGGGGGWDEQDRIRRERRAAWLTLTCNQPIIDAMTAAWERSGNGTLNTEAGFIAYVGSDTRGGIVNLPNTNQFGQITFNLSDVLPQGATLVAIFHTHPTNRASLPSQGDQTASNNLGVPIFVIHRNGVSVYDPALNETFTLRENLEWQQPCS
jgi:RHS repeat-associated protein